MKTQKPKTKKQKTKPAKINLEASYDQTNAQAKDLLTLIAHKLKYSAENIESESLYQVASSIRYWLKIAHKDHPTVRAHIDSEEGLYRYCNKSPRYAAKLRDYADQAEHASAKIFLLTGFLMGIKALHESMDRERAASIYRLTARAPRQLSPKENRDSQLYWALRN